MTMGYDDCTDSELMGRFYDCQEEAFELLARRWWPRLFGFFARLGFSADAAEDLAQEAVIRLYGTKETRSFDARQPLAPFFIRIARNLAVGAWRSGKAGRTVSLDEAREFCPENDEVLPPDLMVALLGCVSDLSDPEQTYVTLCGKHGLGECSHNEIGEVLGKWPAQVTAISQKARAQLRTCLEAKGFR